MDRRAPAVRRCGRAWPRGHPARPERGPHGGLVHQRVSGRSRRRPCGHAGQGPRADPAAAPPDPGEGHRLQPAALPLFGPRCRRGAAGPAATGGELQLPGPARSRGRDGFAATSRARVHGSAPRPRRPTGPPDRRHGTGRGGKTMHDVDLRHGGPRSPHDRAPGANVRGELARDPRGGPP